MNKPLGLARVCPAIRNRTGKSIPGGYNRLYLAVVDGTIPARNENGKWFISEDDLPAVELALGLTTADAPATP